MNTDEQHTNFADKIFEQPWFDVVIREINQISIEIADEIERQTVMIDKGNYKLYQREAPFSRLLCLEIGLAAWLGWILNEKQSDKTKPYSAPYWFKIIRAAFEYGEKLSDANRSKPIKQILSALSKKRDDYQS